MKKFKIITYAAVLIIIVNIIINFIIITNQSDHISHIKKKIMNMRNNQSITIKKTNGEKARQCNDIAMIKEKIPNLFSLSEYALNVRTLMDKNNLAIKNKMVFTPDKNPKFSLFQYNTLIIVSGAYPAVKQFLADILNLEGLKYLSSVSMIRDKNNENRIIFSCRLSVFFKKGDI